MTSLKTPQAREQISADTIPEWAIEQARQVRAEGHQSSDWFLEEPHVLAIAKAIHDAVMAERERCAELLDNCEIELVEYPSKQAAEYYQAGAIDAMIAAADAIRMIPAAPKAGG